MAKIKLAALGKTETLQFGEIEFASHAEYDDRTAIIYYEINNHASRDAHINWDPVAPSRVVEAGKPWASKSQISLSGLGSVLSKPVTTTSNATVNMVGGTTEIEDVPIYLASGKRWMAWIKKIPHAVVEGTKLIVKHYLGGNSPGVILKAVATQVDGSLFQYRYTATAEGNVRYSVIWGHLSSVVQVETPGEEIVIADFKANGQVGLLNDFARMSRDLEAFHAPRGALHKTAAVTVREAQRQIAIVLAPMPYPLKTSDAVLNLRELSHLGQVYSTQYLQTQ